MSDLVRIVGLTKIITVTLLLWCHIIQQKINVQCQYGNELSKCNCTSLLSTKCPSALKAAVTAVLHVVVLFSSYC